MGLEGEFVLPEPVLDYPDGERGTVHRNVEAPEEEGDASDMVFVSVGQKDPAEPVAIFLDI